MKNKNYWNLLLLLMMVAGCRKQDTTHNPSFRSANFADSALQYAKDHISPVQFEALDTAALNVIRYDDADVAVRIHLRDPRIKKFILLHKTADLFTGTWVDLSALNQDSLTLYNGTVSMSDFSNRLLTRYSIRRNSVVDVYNAAAADRAGQHGSARTAISTPDNPQELEDFIVSGRRSYSNLDYYSAYWMFNQGVDYRDSYIPDDQGSGAGTYSSSEIAIAPTFPGPKHPIVDIKKELKCFTIDNKATYSVTVNVNQPTPNTRSVADVSSEHQVGHTFITLQEQFSNGSQIVRNVGFYPLHSAKPGSETDDSVYGDDSDTKFCVSLKITISATEFNQIQSAIFNVKESKYDLDDFNCTTAAINIMGASNIPIPSTVRHLGVFKGNDPGDLGQDIRELNLENFSAKIGGKKVVRSMSPDNTSVPPIRTGNCQ